MLIIFDLDDTLIDTSGSILPFKIKMIIEELLDSGVSIDKNKALNELRVLNAYSSSLQEAFSEFLEINSISLKYLEPILEKTLTNLDDLFAIDLVPNTKEILTELVRKHTLAIVTYGKKQFQLEKLKKAGVDTSVFSRIIVSESKDKMPHYQALLSELDVPASEVLVCGDRIHRDLSPAKELGFKTVHLKWGRGLGEEAVDSAVDFSIANLSEIKVIVNQFENT